MVGSFVSIALAVVTVSVVSWYDIRTTHVPTVLLACAVCSAFLVSSLTPHSIFSAALAALAGGGFFALQYVVSRGTWVGGADIVMGIVMGLILGWPLVLLAVCISYLLGGAVAIGLLSAKRASWRSELPFIPLLSAGTVITLLWGNYFLKLIGF